MRLSQLLNENNMEEWVENLHPGIIKKVSPLGIEKGGLFTLLPLNGPLESLSSHEILLWRRVIDKALVDSISPSRPWYQAPAIDWFDPSNEDFLEVCSLASLSPIEVIDTYIIVQKINRIDPDTPMKRWRRKSPKNSKFAVIPDDDENI